MDKDGKGSRIAFGATGLGLSVCAGFLLSAYVSAGISPRVQNRIEQSYEVASSYTSTPPGSMAFAQDRDSYRPAWTEADANSPAFPPIPTPR